MMRYGLGVSSKKEFPQTGLFPQVLMVTNHREAIKKMSYAGVFAERQLVSLETEGAKINIFDFGRSHSPITLFRKWLELRRQVMRLRPDLIHGRYGTIVGFLAGLTGRPSVVTFCGSDLNTSATVSFMRRWLGLLLSNLAALLASKLICVSQELRERLWWCQEKAVVIPDGVDLNLFSPGPQDEARKELGWDPQRPIVIHNA